MELAEKIGEISGGGLAAGRTAPTAYEAGEAMPIKESIAGPTISLASLGSGVKSGARNKPAGGFPAKGKPKPDRPRAERPQSKPGAPAERQAKEPLMPRFAGVAEDSEKKLFDARCSLCHKDFKLKFKPEMGRPAYCDECFKKVKEERRKKPQERSQAVKMLDGAVARQDSLEAAPMSLSELLPKQPAEPPAIRTDSPFSSFADNDDEIEELYSPNRNN